MGKIIHARTISIAVEVEIYMGDFSDSDLAQEVNRRRRNKEWDESEAIGAADEYNLPIENLDFRMKLELFLEAWEKYSFTDLKEKLQ